MKILGGGGLDFVDFFSHRKFGLYLVVISKHFRHFRVFS